MSKTQERIKMIKEHEEEMFDLYVKLGQDKFLEMLNIPTGSATHILGESGLNWYARNDEVRRKREDHKYNNWLDLNSFDTWYFIGYFLGSGSMYGSGDSYTVKVVSKDEDLLEKIASRFNTAVFPIRVNINTYTTGRKYKDYQYCFEVHSQSVFSVLYDIGFRAVESFKGCRIQEPPTEHIGAFLRGLFDADGVFNTGGKAELIFNGQPSGMSLVSELLASLGIKNTQHNNLDRPIYVTVMSEEDLQELFYKFYPIEGCLKNERKYKLFEQWMCNQSNIESIEYTDEKMEMMDMEVEEFHNFYANGILVLNCAQELRLPSILCGEPTWLVPFSKGEDVHKHTAEIVWGKENYDKSKRKMAKVFNFSLQYGGTPYTLQQKLHISDINECQKLFDLYMKATTTLHAWQNYQVKKAKALGYVKTYFGFERRVKFYLDSPEPKMRSFGRRTVANTLIQTTGAYCTKLSMCKLWNQLLDPKLRFDSLGNPIKEDYGKPPIPGVSEPSGCRFMSTIHDEVNLSIPYVDENTGEVTERSLKRFNNYLTIFHHCMKLQLKGWPIPLDVGVSLGTTQGTMFDIEMDFNPDGSFKSWTPKWDIVEAPKEEIKEVQQKKVEEIPEFLL